MSGLCLSVCLFVCLFVYLFAKNSKTTQHISLKLCMYTIHDNEREISYFNFEPWGGPAIYLIIFSSCPPEANVSLNIQTQHGDVHRHD